ncbi:MAG: mechanosensitive ion channel [Prevotella sp.]|nr:mechanosensitive ion channel [Bacteroides sp.]MCM1366628.1 mechanosensitive ion channel [Prevotella sp.]MCM1436993.1 mechanosensitive ion channel [Prevotella sp.]
MIQSEAIPVVPIPDNPPSGKTWFSMFEGLSFDDAISKMANSIVDFGFKLLIAIAIFYVGKVIIHKIYRMTRSVLINRHVDPSLSTFILSLIKIVLYFILIITVIGIIGIETSSFLALFASAGVAIGMALSGTLQNFAGGVLILLLKPYKVGDYIEAQGFTGTVKAIQIFHTVINTVDNKAIIIPNGGLSTDSINNYSHENYRRVDWTISLAYGTDFESARDVILEMLLEDNRVIKKYVDEFEEKRASSDNSENMPEGNDSCRNKEECESEIKQSAWKRFLSRRKKHREDILHKLHDQELMNSGLPVKADRSPFVGLNELADSSINLTVRAWTRSEDYWGVYFDMNRRFYSELPQKGFEFPFPQLDVHLSRTC